MEYRLEEIAMYSNKKIDIEKINFENYISTENMLPNKLGITKATTLPNQSKVNYFEEKNILISNIRPYFKKIWFANFNGGCSNDVLNILVNDEKKVLPKYLYYNLFQDNFFDYVMSGSTGTKMPRGNKKHVLQYTVNIPDIKTQTKIVNILDTLDKKIELNNQINDNLYKILNSLYKSWFEDFDNFKYQKFKESEIGKIPNNFDVIELNDLINIRGGLAYKASKLSEDHSDNILVSMGSVELNKMFNFNNLKYYSEDVVDKYVAEVGDLFICTRDVTQQRNQLGCPGLIPKLFENKKTIIGTNLYIVDYKKIGKILNKYMFLLLNSSSYRERIVGSAKGTAVLMIAKDDILKFKFPFPKSEIIIYEFNKIITPLFELIENNVCENNKLEQLRDTLLPKLMNGEIDLDNIEI